MVAITLRACAAGFTPDTALSQNTKKQQPLLASLRSLGPEVTAVRTKQTPLGILAFKPNLATIKYLNIKFLVFQNKLPKILKVACESRQFRNPGFFKYLITLKFSDLHMEDHMV